MEDFSRFGELTPEWLEWVEQHGQPAPAPIHQVPAEKLQELLNEVREKLSADALEAEGLHTKVSIKSIQIPAGDGYSIPARIYSPKVKSGHQDPEKPVLLPVYIHYHGGGFLYGSLSSEDVGCARIVNSLPVIVVNVCYRHTPQSRYPTQRNDAFDSYDWTVLNIKSFGGDPDNIIVGGISAGANLAAAIVLRENLKAKEQTNTASTANKTELKHIKGQVLIIPWLIIQEDKYPYELFTSKEKSSRVQCADAAVLPDEVIKWFVENLKLDSTQSRTDPFLDVGLATDKEVEGMPKTFFVIAGRDPLRDDGLLYARKLHRNGVPTEVHVFPGLPHAFSRFEGLPSNPRWHELLTLDSIAWVLKDNKLVAEGDMEIITEAPAKK